MSHSPSNSLESQDVSKINEKFLKEFSRNFYKKIIDTNDFNTFENILSKWIKNLDKKNIKSIFELMQNHEQTKFWFSSIIGFFYQLGINCDVDKNKALELYLLSVNNDEKKILNQNFTHLLLLEGDDDEFNTLRNINIIIGKYLLSLFYYKDIILVKRFKAYLESVEKSDPKVQYNIGDCYYYGRGVAQDYKKAFEWYLKSANDGCASGQCNLGYCYGNAIGTNKDYKKAFEWYLKSAALGCAVAKYNLGYCYQHVAQDHNQAFEWYLKSANDGCADAQYGLGYCYHYGIGTGVNIKEALIWYKKASDNGIKSASIELNKISSE